MAISLLIEHLTKSFGDRMIFADFTLGINEGDKIGIIARNGAGKSTLLRTIAGIEAADSGTVTPRSGLRVAMLEQDTPFAPDAPILDAALAIAQERSQLPQPIDRDALARLMTQLGVTRLDAPSATLSGGQRKRAAIAATLIQEPDILLLDEPTNHLDIPAAEWLEAYLRRSRATVLLVTHDRYLLERACSKMLEIDRGEVYVYEGAYHNFLRRRSERIEAAAAQLARTRNTLRREQEWMSRQPQARGTKQKSRIDRFYQLKDASQVSLTERGLDLSGNAASYIGSKIFEARHIRKAYGEKVILSDFSYTFARGEKIGIIGPNGAGKTTFARMLQGLETTDGGTWDVGQTVRFGHFSQEGLKADPGKRVIDVITDIADDIPTSDGTHISPSQLLQRFLFPYADQQKYVYKLSGGERRRLHLATVLMRRPNFLILDEPTNDLDIPTLGLLEDYLANFGGCAIIISHDRYFLDNIVDHLFVMEGDGTVRDFPGTYSEYRAWRTERDKAEAAAEAPETKTSTRPRAERKPKLTYKQRREMEALEAEIQALTEEKTALEATLSSGGSAEEIRAASERYAAVSERLDEAEMRWLELSEIED